MAEYDACALSKIPISYTFMCLHGVVSEILKIEAEKNNNKKTHAIEGNINE